MLLGSLVEVKQFSIFRPIVGFAFSDSSRLLPFFVLRQLAFYKFSRHCNSFGGLCNCEFRAIGLGTGIAKFSVEKCHIGTFARIFYTCSSLPFVVNYAVFLIYVSSVKITLIYTIASVIRHRLSSVDLVVG